MKARPELVKLAQQEAATLIAEFTAQDRSTADAIHRALAQSLYAAAIGAAVEAKLAELESKVAGLERRLAAAGEKK